MIDYNSIKEYITPKQLVTYLSGILIIAGMVLWIIGLFNGKTFLHSAYLYSIGFIAAMISTFLMK